MKDKIKSIIAIILFKIGVRPRATMFIDEETIMYGYGKCYDVGVFEYHLPSKYVIKKRNRSVPS